MDRLRLFVAAAALARRSQAVAAEADVYAIVGARVVTVSGAGARVGHDRDCATASSRRSGPTRRPRRTRA